MQSVPGGTLDRLSSDGKLYTWPFAWSSYDVRTVTGSGRSDKQIAEATGLIWNQREDRYSGILAEETVRGKVGMSYYRWLTLSYTLSQNSPTPSIRFGEINV